MLVLHCFSSHAHVFKDFSVGVGVLQGFSLVLDGGQRPVDLSQLFLIALFSLQGQQGGCMQRQIKQRQISYEIRPRADQKQQVPGNLPEATVMITD